MSDDVEQKGPRWGIRWYPFTRKHTFRVGLLFSFLMAQWLGFKLHKYSLLTHGQDTSLLYLLVPIWFWDVVVLIVLALFFLFWLDNTKGWLQRIGNVALFGFILFAMILATVEHRFFLVTYTAIDWKLLKYGIAQLPMLFSMVVSQLNPFTLLFLLLPVGVVLSPLWVERRARLQAWFEHPSETKRWGSGFDPFIFLLMWVTTFSMHQGKMPNDLLPLKRNFAMYWAGGILQESTALKSIVSRPQGQMLFDAQRLHFVPTSQTRKPNIVVIVLESMRYRSTTLADPGLQTTPFLAKLAKKSWVSHQMYPVIPHTSKAFISIFCGIYPKISMTVVEGEPNGVPARCLPRLLQSIGYQTAIFHPATARFENYDQLAKNAGFASINLLENFASQGFFRTNYFGYEDRIMMKPSMAWLDRAQSKKQPFFLAYHTLVSHHGYMTPPNFRKRKFVKTKDKEYQQYLNSLRYTDDFVKDLFQKFRQRGLMKSTVFVLVSDHGEAFGEHKRRQHDNGMWEEILRIPTLIYSPTYFPKPKRIQGIRQQIDILPTLADILKVKIRGGVIPGKSLLKPVSPKRTLYMSCWYEKFCMSKRTGSMKYIYHYNHRAMEKYDLNEDPREKHPIALSKEDLSIESESILTWKSKVNAVYEAPDPGRLFGSIVSKEPKLDQRMSVQFGDYVRLVGIRQHSKLARPGYPFELTYVFHVLKKIPPKWQLFYHLHTDKPVRFVNLDHPPVGGSYPLPLWKPGQYILDRHRFHIPADFLSNAKVTLSLGFWSTGEERLPLKGVKGRPEEVKAKRFNVWTGTLQAAPLSVKKRPPIATLLGAQLGSYLKFVGYNLHSHSLEPKKKLDITLVYRVLKRIPKGWQLFFHLEQAPDLFLNADQAYVRSLEPLHQWTPRTYVQVRLQQRIPSTFKLGKAMHMYTGMWKSGQKNPTITGPKDSVITDKKGERLLVIRKVMEQP